MFKRVRWTLFGAAVGLGGSVWARWRINRMVRRYPPLQWGSEVHRRVGAAGNDLRAAIDEGRAAMAEREAELRAGFAGRLVAPPPRMAGTIIEAEPLPTPTAAPLPARRSARGSAAQPSGAQPSGAQPAVTQPAVTQSADPGFGRRSRSAALPRGAPRRGLGRPRRRHRPQRSW